MSAEAVSAIELCEQAESCTATAGFIYDHIEDSDKADELILLMASLRDTRQAIDECYKAVERHVLNLDIPKSFEVVGLGLVERKRSIKRTSWDHDAVRHELVKYAATIDANPLDVVWRAMRPSWRVNDLRACGLTPDEFCVEEPQSESVVLPSRDLSERGTSFRSDAA